MCLSFTGGGGGGYSGGGGGYYSSNGGGGGGGSVSGAVIRSGPNHRGERQQIMGTFCFPTVCCVKQAVFGHGDGWSRHRRGPGDHHAANQHCEIFTPEEGLAAAHGGRTF